MRGLIPALATPTPLAELLPALLQDDDVAQQLAAAFDDALAPILSTLDNFDSYLDPTLAPDDFVEWLAGWVGIAMDENWPLDRRREMVANGSELFRRRGTVRGLAELVSLQVGVEAEVIDNGGVSWSPVPAGSLPGTSAPSLTVRIRVEDPDAINLTQLESVIVAARPAHVPHRIEIVAS
jgi:phage tail-like protein